MSSCLLFCLAFVLHGVCGEMTTTEPYYWHPNDSSSHVHWSIGGWGIGSSSTSGTTSISFKRGIMAIFGVIVLGLIAVLITLSLSNGSESDQLFPSGASSVMGGGGGTGTGTGGTSSVCAIASNAKFGAMSRGNASDATRSDIRSKSAIHPGQALATLKGP